MNARCQRDLARRNHGSGGSSGEEIVEKDTEEEEILEERDATPIHIFIPSTRGRGGSTAVAAVPALIYPGIWLSMVNVKPPHLADLEVESMKKLILDYMRYSQKCSRQSLRKIYSGGATRGHI